MLFFLPIRRSEARKTHHLTTLALWLVLSLLGAVAQAEEIDKVHIVVPGATTDALDLPANGLVAAFYGPFHGTLNLAAGTYEPGDSFWQVGGDFAIFQVHVPGQPAIGWRIRWVMGDPSPEGFVIDTDDPGHGTWIPWTIDDSPANPVAVVPGVAENDAWEVTYNPQAPPVTISGVLDGTTGSGVGTVTTTDGSGVLDDVEHQRDQLGLDDTVTIYRVLEEQTLVAEVLMRWNELATTWEIALSSPTDVSLLEYVPFDFGYNRIRVSRWTHHAEETAGTDLWLNDVLVDRRATIPRDGDSNETVELTLEAETNDAAGLQITFEGMTTRSSDDMVTNDELVIAESFTDLSPAWKIQGNSNAIRFAPQQLPGPGRMFELDLSMLGNASMSIMRSANLEIPTETLSQPLPLDSRGYGFRFWMDTDTANLVPGSHLDIFRGYGPVAGNPMVIRLERDLSGLRLVARFLQDDGTVASVDAPLSGSDQLIEIRLRNAVAPGHSNGWAELWVGGALADRLVGLGNHGSQLGDLGIGGFSVPSGTTGTLVIDEFQAWRFD